MFLETINHVTGQREWTVKNEDYDCAQELARSRFGDMILDYDRNDKFLAGLKEVIKEKIDGGEDAHVLDIGTGTGLLSLMAAREGATSVTAVEAFEPMAKCAKEIVSRSEWKDKIEVISGRSTDIEEILQKTNIIVAEVFDTELIGEGALRTFKHALQNFAKNSCRVVPSTGKVYVLPVQSEFLKKFNDLSVLGDDTVSSCTGTSSVFDLHLSAVDQNDFIALADPIEAFSFNFEDAESIIFDEEFVRNATCIESGTFDAILMWWDLDMDGKGKNFIRMGPNWQTKEYYWRSHWIQAVYYPPTRVRFEKNATISVRCAHDEYSMWFDTNDDGLNKRQLDRHYCTCSLHSLFSRQTIYHINEIVSDKLLDTAVKRIVTGKSVVCLGEGSFLFVVAARHASTVVCVETNPHIRQVISRLNLPNVAVVDDLDKLSSKPDLVLAEPFYLSAMNPWQNLRYLYDLEKLKEKFGSLDVHPKTGRLVGQLMNFDHLHKISKEVGTVNGFDLSHFDEISNKARQATDAIIDEEPLWEYWGKVVENASTILKFDVDSLTPAHDSREVDMSKSNGIALWMEWDLDDSYVMNTGVNSPAKIGENADWNKGYKQGVYLPCGDRQHAATLTMNTDFDPRNGEITFHFLP